MHRDFIQSVQQCIVCLGIRWILRSTFTIYKRVLLWPFIHNRWCLFYYCFFSLHLCVFMSCNIRVCVYNVYEIYVVSLYKKRNENQTIVRALTAFPTGDKKSTHTHTLKEMNEPRNQLEIINLSRVTYFLLSIFNTVSSWAHGTGIRMINRLQWANIMSYM